MTTSKAVRNGILMAVIMPGLAACSSDEGSDWSMVFQLAKNYWNGPPAITLQQAGAIPYATIGVRIGDGPQAIFVLASSEGGDLLWVLGRSVALGTRNGRIIRSEGLTHDLAAFLPERKSASAPSWAPGGTITWTADFPDRRLYAVSVKCSRSAGVNEVISILGNDFHVQRVDESCDADAIGWSFTNSYWLSPTTGFVGVLSSISIPISTLSS